MREKPKDPTVPSKRPMSKSITDKGLKRDWTNRKFMVQNAVRMRLKRKKLHGVAADGPPGQRGEIIDIEAISEEVLPDVD